MKYPIMSPDKYSPEIRWVPAKRPARGKRPNDFVEPMSDPLKECPFCPGNEHMTGPESYAIREDPLKKDGPGWTVRCFPNLYPAFRARGEGEVFNSVDDGIFKSIESTGYHEVVVDSVDHGTAMASLPVSQVHLLLETYIERLKTMAADPKVKCVLVVKNHGYDAGASLEHPHTQILGTPMVPSLIVDDLEFFNSHDEGEGRCVLDQIIEKEIKDGTRIIAESEHYVVWSPFWARFPYECWIVPKEHEQHFHNIGDVEVKDLAGVLRDTLSKIAVHLNDPDHNFFIHSAPCDGGDYGNFHWYLEVLPRIIKIAGSEEATGFYVNPVTPEYATEVLRRPLASDK